MNGGLDARPAAGKAERALRERLEAARTRALHEIGRRAAGYARARCPVETGRLRESIGYSVEGASVRLTSGAPYAPCVENGTKGRKAQPFMRPALAEHTREYAQILRREIEQSGKGRFFDAPKTGNNRKKRFCNISLGAGRPERRRHGTD